MNSVNLRVIGMSVDSKEPSSIEVKVEDEQNASDESEVKKASKSKSNGKKISISAIKSLENIPLVEGRFKTNDYVKFVRKINQSDLALNQIESLYFHKNKRWDIKTKNGFLIMLPSKNIHKKLSIANELILNSDLKDFNKIDLRIKNKIITSYE